LILNLDVWPELLTENELDAIEDVFELSCEDTTDGSFYHFANVTLLNNEDSLLLLAAGKEITSFSLTIQVIQAAAQRALGEDGSWGCALPSRDEFLTMSKEKIKNLASIENVLDITKLQPVDCSPDSNDFSSVFAMSVSGDPSNMSQADLGLLDNYFRATYNAMGKETCDLLFRSIKGVNVTLAGGSNPTIGGSGENHRNLRFNRFSNKFGSPTDNVTSLMSSTPMFHAPREALTTLGPELFTLLFSYDGLCRGCPSDQSLFDQVAPGTRSTLRTLHIFQNEDQCLCPEDADFRGPTKEDFLDSWSSNVIEGKQFPFFQEAPACFAASRSSHGLFCRF
jgi:hypothetical protein